MPSRRTHAKTRHGCIHCKSAHVKCDEGRPACGLCTRTKRFCEYALPSANAPHNTSIGVASLNNWPYANLTMQSDRFSSISQLKIQLPRPVQNDADTRSFVIQGDPFLNYCDPINMPASFEHVKPLNMKSTDADSTSHFTFEDLELIHNYTLRTSHTLADFKAFQSIWSETIVCEAHSHPFLMHGILAISALHLASMSTSTEASASHPDLSHNQRRSHYSRLAHMHFGHCITKYQGVLTKITKANSNALFAASSGIAILAMAFPHSPCRRSLRSNEVPSHLESHTHIEDAVAQMSDIFTLLRGTSAVVSTALDWIFEGSLAPLLRGGYLGIPEADLPKDDAEALERLETANRLKSQPETDRKAYKNAIEKLKICYKRVMVNPGDRGQVMSWAISLETSYLDRLRRMESLALIILAYFAVMLYTIDENWWAKSWGPELARNVHEILQGGAGGSDHEIMVKLTEWPMKKVGLIPRLHDIA